jgi:mRNA interferase MazF
MARILRGEIWWADLDPVRGHEQGGRRPFVVISQDLFNQSSGTVIALAVTSKLPSAPYPLTLEITDTGLPRRSWVKISQIRVLATERISTKIGQLSSTQLTHLIVGFNEIIGDDLASPQEENG